MKRQKTSKAQKIAVGLIGMILILLFLFLHSPLNIFSGLFLSVYAPHLKAIPLLEIGLHQDRDGIPTYRSPLYLEGHYDNDPYIDTIFAKDFTPKKFEQVKERMSQKQVVELLGKPLAYDSLGYQTEDNPNQIVSPKNPRTQECWRYTSDGKLAQSGDASWYSFIICFNNGVVIEKQSNEFYD